MADLRLLFTPDELTALHAAAVEMRDRQERRNNALPHFGFRTAGHVASALEKLLARACPDSCCDPRRAREDVVGPAAPGAIRCLSCGASYDEAPPGWDCPGCGGPVSQHAGTIHVGRGTDA